MVVVMPLDSQVSLFCCLCQECKKTAPERNGLCCLLLGFVVFVGLILKPMWGRTIRGFFGWLPCLWLEESASHDRSINSRERSPSLKFRGSRLGAFGAFESQMSREASLIRAYADAVNLHKFNTYFHFSLSLSEPFGVDADIPKMKLVDQPNFHKLPVHGNLHAIFLGEALTAQWVQSGDRIQAVVIRNVTWVQLDLDRWKKWPCLESSKAMPCQWAVNAVNTMLSPQLKGQLHGDNIFFRGRRCKPNQNHFCCFFWQVLLCFKWCFMDWMFWRTQVQGWIFVMHEKTDWN